MVPRKVPDDYDLPMLRRLWQLQKREGEPTAFNASGEGAPARRVRQGSPVQAWIKEDRNASMLEKAMVLGPGSIVRFPPPWPAPVRP